MSLESEIDQGRANCVGEPQTSHVLMDRNSLSDWRLAAVSLSKGIKVEEKVGEGNVVACLDEGKKLTVPKGQVFVEITSTSKQLESLRDLATVTIPGARKKGLNDL